MPSPHSVASSPPSSELTDERKSPVTSSDASSSSGELRHPTADLFSELVDPWKPRLLARASKPRSQRGERNLLPCEVCGKAFDRPSLLKRHMRTHTGMFNFPMCKKYGRKCFDRAKKIVTYTEFFFAKSRSEVFSCLLRIMYLV